MLQFLGFFAFFYALFLLFFAFFVLFFSFFLFSPPDIVRYIGENFDPHRIFLQGVEFGSFFGPFSGSLFGVF